jgi:hypothetical protein
MGGSLLSHDRRIVSPDAASVTARPESACAGRGVRLTQ